MKKMIMLAAAVVLAMQVAGAQEIRTPAEIKSALSNAEKAAADAKKAEKMATWLKLGQVNLDAYVSAQGYGSLGQDEQSVRFLMSSEKDAPVSEETVSGVPMKKVSYSTADYYYQDGILAMINITKPFTDNALQNAADAYVKAYSLDTKGQKTKDIVAALEKINEFVNNEAYNAYRFGDLNAASKLFEKAYDMAALAPLSKVDSAALYNSALAAWYAGSFERAAAQYEKSIAIDYAGDDGDAYVKLADIASKQGDNALSKSWLEKGFVKFPQSQGILVGLINYYINNDGDTAELFSLLDKAKANEPGNASLYYVEGNIHKNLGEVEAAVAAYDKCGEISPSYEYGYIGKGILYYEEALKFQDLASAEMDDAKWNEYNTQFKNSLKACIEPFEKAFEICPNEDVRKSICEYLKNACYRFCTEDDIYMEKYKKYSAVLGE